tara:strand:- start:702 stop:2792 length:2091 start_codon:yes stop_codon:yes gene_type:complete
MASNTTPAIILQNELSGLDNVAYKIKFFMIHPNHPDGIKGDALDKKYVESISKIIIAETGTTNAFYVKDLGFSNAVSFRQQLSPMGITGQLNIIEPYGMSLYERLVAASHKLDIENHLEAKYIIQINFQGYKPDGQQTVVDYEWFVPVWIVKMSSAVTEQGSDYTIQFVGMNYLGNTNVASTSKEPFVIKAETFGDFLDQYVAALNENQQALVEEDSQMKPDKFIIKFDEGYGPGLKTKTSWTKPTVSEIRNYTLGANEPTTKKTSRSQDFTSELIAGPDPRLEHTQFQKRSIIKLTASKGTTIDSFITGVFMQTPKMKELTKSGAAQALGNSGITSKAGFEKIIKNERAKLSKLDEFSEEAGWYDLENKWFMTISTEIKEGDWDPIRNTYQKTYTKVLQQFRVYHVIRDGYEINRTTTIGLKRITEGKMKSLTEHGLLRKAYYWIYTGKNIEVLNFNFSLDNLYYVATDVYMNSNLGERAATAGRGRIDVVDSKHTTTREETIIDPTARPADIHPPLPKFEEYIEDMHLSAGSRLHEGPFARPSFIPDVIPKDLIYGIGAGGAPGVKDPGRIVYNINSGDMMELQLQIRGDPFWLGHTGPGSKNIPEDKFAPWSKGANYLYIEFKVPHDGVDPESGQMALSVANSISGIYFITNVQSNFSDGQFVQSLTGYLDIHFGLTQVRNAIRLGDDRMEGL